MAQDTKGKRAQATRQRDSSRALVGGVAIPVNACMLRGHVKRASSGKARRQKSCMHVRARRPMTPSKLRLKRSRKVTVPWQRGNVTPCKRRSK